MSMPESNIEISVVVPVYNSEACLDALVHAVHAALNAAAYELILVNDRSSDGSWNRICALVHGNPHVIGINLRKNSGQDNALMAGFRHVHGRYVVIMDDDLQHDPADIPRLWRACKEHGADVCFAQFDEKQHALWKNVGSWLNGKVAEIVIGKPPHIYLSPFKIVARDVVAEIVRYDGPFPYVDGLLFTVTENVVQIPAEHHPRHAGRSTYSLFKSVMVAARLATSYSVLPLRIASLFGFATAIAGFGLGVYFLLEAMFVGRPVGGFASQIVTTLFLGGVTLVAIGLMGEYVGRSYLNLNKQPQYTVKDVVVSEKTGE